MKLHPLLVIFGVLAGASIAGVAGSFLSVPVLATLRIVYRQLLTKAPSVVVAPDAAAPL
jgi:predicted PurR-regulated permease PerM